MSAQYIHWVEMGNQCGASLSIQAIRDSHESESMIASGADLNSCQAIISAQVLANKFLNDVLI